MMIAFLAAVSVSVPPKPVVDPLSWFSPDTYPAQAENEKLEGVVGFEVDVDPTGKPVGCRIVKSSGQPILDQATCDAIRSKALFDPAKGPDGRPVAGKYSNTTVWRLSGAPSTGHSAVILNFKDDYGHPSCEVQSAGSSEPAPTCDQLLAKLGATISSLGPRFTKFVVLTSAASSGQEPYRGEADWGVRLSYLASDQYFLDGPKPVACVNVAAEGMDTGQDPCARMGGGQRQDETAMKNARKIRMEVSMYGAPRK